jgi:pimeloyl-ACP methyl ester carboxylesterase
MKNGRYGSCRFRSAVKRANVREHEAPVSTDAILSTVQGGGCPGMRPPATHYACNGDVHLAYQVVGDGPVDLVIAPGFISHCDLNWTMPAYVDFIERLALLSRVILFDKRGTGLSDVSLDAASFEARMSDIGIVMDAARSERAVLFGYSEGGPMACLYAATHPDRVESLILDGTFASGRCIPEKMIHRMEDAIDNWGQGRTAGIFLGDLDRPVRTSFSQPRHCPEAASVSTQLRRHANPAALAPPDDSDPPPRRSVCAGRVGPRTRRRNP